MLLRLLCQAPFNSPGGDLRPRGEAQLGEDAAYVGLHRALADDELVGDSAIGFSLSDQRGHVALAGGQASKLLLCDLTWRGPTGWRNDGLGAAQEACTESLIGYRCRELCKDGAGSGMLDLCLFVAALLSIESS